MKELNALPPLIVDVVIVVVRPCTLRVVAVWPSVTMLLPGDCRCTPAATVVSKLRTRVCIRGCIPPMFTA